jgi:hypothetical protein
MIQTYHSAGIEQRTSTGDDKPNRVVDFLHGIRKPQVPQLEALILQFGIRIYLNPT